MRARVLFLSLALAVATGCSNKNEINVVFDGGRIVSMTPSVTETLFALGLGKNVVGVSRFCAWPPEVDGIAKVGGLLDPDIEAIVRLSPTCAVMQQNSTDIGERLESFKIPVKYVKSNTLDEVLESFVDVGRTFGKEKEGLELRRRVEDSLGHGKACVPRKVLLVLWRDVGGGIKDMTIAGDDGYYSEIFRRFNCTLVHGGTAAPYPTISAEGVLALKPDIIVELLTGLDAKAKEAAAADWRKSLPDLDAKTVVLTDQCAVVPGPRIVDFSEMLEKLLSGVDL